MLENTWLNYQAKFLLRKMTARAGVLLSDGAIRMIF
jgi:hypothetical protein